jgi:leucyl/phenylalanyl-tRNA---protein transferase
MALHFLDDELWFPDVEEALPDGLLAAGGDLSTERILLACRNGIFPWFNDDDPPLWWSPDPRFVLFPDELKVSKSMRQLLKNNEFEFKVNTDFEAVIYNCRSVLRNGVSGTWITDEVAGSYTELHRMGVAHCAESWVDGELVGGLYGVLMGKVFFGESMFSLRSNASKYAFICFVEQLREQGIALIDCQVYTDHLKSLGARSIPRQEFKQLLEVHIEDAKTWRANAK